MEPDLTALWVKNSTLKTTIYNQYLIIKQGVSFLIFWQALNK